MEMRLVFGHKPKYHIIENLHIQEPLTSDSLRILAPDQLLWLCYCLLLFEIVCLSHTKILLRSFSDRNFTGGYFWEKLGETEEELLSDEHLDNKLDEKETRQNDVCVKTINPVVE